MLVRVGSLMSRLRNGLGNIRISPTLGSLTWTGYNPDIGGGTRLLYPAPAALSWTTYAPSIALMIAVGVGAATYTGNAPTVTGVSQPSAAETLAGSETDALAIVYTDDHFKATTGFNGSVYCLDSGTPANDYDNSPTTEASSYFTYTNPSPKMILHDDGVLKYAAHNLLSIPSEDFSGAGWTENAIGTIAAPSTTGPDGETSGTVLTASSGSAAHAVYNSSTISATANAAYRATCNFKAGTHDYVFLTVGGASETRVGAVFDLSAGDGAATETDVGASSGAVISTQLTSLGGGWYRAELAMSSNQTNLYFVIGFAEAATGNTFDITQQVTFNAAGTETIEIHGAHIHRYPADTTYLRTTSAARFSDPIEFNSSGTSLGLLVEPQRTNLALYSREYSNGAWTKNAGLTVSSGAASSPFGAGTASKFIPGTSSGYHLVRQAVTAGSATQVHYAILKAGEYQFAGVTIANGVGYTKNYQVLFDLSDGTYQNTASATYTGSYGSTSLGDGWYLYWVAITNGDTGAGQMVFDIVPYASAAQFGTAWAGDGTSGIFACASQAEVGSKPTSHIETFGSTVTRAADLISLATSVFPYGASANTFYIDASSDEYIATGGRLFEASPTARADVVQLRDNGANTLWQNFSGGGFSVDAQYGFTTPTRGTLYKSAFACEDNNINGSYEGAVGTNDTSCDYQNTAHTKISLGGNVSGGELAHCHIAAVLIVPRRVSDADMQTLTSTGALP